MKDKNILKLKAIIEDETANLSLLRNELKSSPISRLGIRNHSGHYYFSEITPKTEFGISKNHARITELARKAYLKSIIQKHTSDLASINRCYKAITNTGVPYVVTRFRKAGLTEAFYSATELKWRKHAQSCNPYKREHLRYASTGGIVLRSKSERTIANRLEHWGISYLYEPCIKINDGRYEVLANSHTELQTNSNNEKIFYPDFLIRTDSGKLIIWEHFGLLNEQNYAFNAYKKINIYNSIGFNQHTNLVCTEEKDIDDIKILDDIILRFLA